MERWSSKAESRRRFARKGMRPSASRASPRGLGVAAPEPDESSSVSLSSEAGTKRLLTEKLEAFFRPGGEDLERVRALDGGRLIMKLPEGSREGGHQDLSGYTLVFEFDEEGRLDVPRGGGGGAQGA